MTPWVTIGLLALLFYMYFQFVCHGLLWLKVNSFCPEKCYFFWLQQSYLPLASMTFWSTFCSANIWHMLGGAYFLWVFGSTVELRLGLQRYLVLVVMSWLGSWLIVSLDAGLASSGLYIGPGFLTAGIIGAYLLFFPEKKINPGGNIGRSTSIFKHEPDEEPAAHFGISPWWLLISFVFFEVAMHFILTNMSVQFDNLRFVPTVGAFLLGLVSCALLVAQASRGRAGNPLTVLAVQHYRHLRTLDLGHEESLEGTAKLMSCPVEQVRVWVSKGGKVLPQKS